jgi:protein involved in polysaccharide export with SLBB domain
MILPRQIYLEGKSSMLISIKKKLLFCLIFLFASLILFAQGVDIQQELQNLPGGGTPEAAQEEELVESQVERLQLAISNENYPATPGDIYRLTFTTAGNLITNQLIVESDYSVNLGALGTIDARGKSFPQLKRTIEQLIMEGYPRSIPSVTMISTGTFQVPVVGEIPQTRYVIAWGLSRLSEVISGALGRHSSIRNVKIISKDGVAREYDIWMARYKGDLSQNPYVQPGDRVEISRVKKEIRISGEVYRPGVYQLKEGESLGDIKFFSGGFTPLADLQRVTIERYGGSQAELIVIDFEDYQGRFEFEDRDIITIPSKRDDTLMVTVVGAVFNPGRYPYTPPETYMYYANLAGGIDFERNAGNEVLVTDRFGNEKDPGYPIAAGDTITVLNNSFVYNFNRYFPVVSTGFAFIATIISIITLSNQ